MRKIVSNEFLIAAQAAGKTLHWKYSHKLTDNLDELQSAGTWIDVTDYIQKDVPDTDEQLEVILSQFTASSLDIVGLDINWWSANIFNTTKKYIECKIEVTLNDLTADTITTFGGWVDKKGDQFVWKETNADDKVTFTIFSYQEFCERMSAFKIINQLIADTDSLGVSCSPGVRLELIPGVFVNANVPGYRLLRGVHTITFTPTSQLRLDGGRQVAIPYYVPSLLTLGDAELEVNDTQRIIISTAPNDILNDLTRTQDIIVLDSVTDVLPSVWFNRYSVYGLLKELFTKVGVTQFNFDVFNLPTYDGRHVTSLFEIPCGTTYPGITEAIAYKPSSAQLWIATRGANVWTRDMVTHAYTNIGYLTYFDGYSNVPLRAKRFFTEDDSNLWVLCENAEGGDQYLAAIDMQDYGNQSTYQLSHRGFIYAQAQKATVNLCFDPIHRKFYYAKITNDFNDNRAWSIYSFDCATQTESIFFNIATSSLTGEAYGSGYSSVGNAFAYGYACMWIAGSNLFYSGNFGVVKCPLSGATPSSFTFIPPNPVGSYNLVAEPIVSGVYHPIENRYYFSMGLDNSHIGIYSIDCSSGTLTTITTSYSGNNFIYDSIAAKVICWLGKDVLQIATLLNNTMTMVPGRMRYQQSNDDLRESRAWNTGNEFQLCLGPASMQLYGVMSRSQVLFQFFSKISMFIDQSADYEGSTSTTGESILDALKELCVAYNLIPRITTDKRGVVQRRGQDDGSLITTSNQLVITNDHATKDVIVEYGATLCYDVIIAQNNNTMRSYGADGEDAIAFDDQVPNTVQNKFINDDLLIDFAFWIYQFYKTPCTKITIPTPLIPYFQHEPFDGLSAAIGGNVNLAIAAQISQFRCARSGKTEIIALTKDEV